MNINYERPIPKTTLFEDICLGEVFRDEFDNNSFYLRIEDACIDGDDVNCVDLSEGVCYHFAPKHRCISLIADLNVRNRGV